MFIAGTGMVCAIGLNAAAACAAQRAGISAFAELPFHDNEGEPFVGAAVPGVDVSVTGERRLLELLTRAVSELGKSVAGLPWEETPLLIGLAEPGQPGGGAGLAESLVERLQERLSVRFHAESRTFCGGHTAGFEALRAARDLLKTKGTAACVVCGVDSFINARSLWWLDRAYRLKTTMNRDGVIPGEAAAAILLRNTRDADTGTRVIGLGFGKEKAHILSEEPLLGLGMTEAARKALEEAGLGLHEMDWRISDATGEMYRFKELPLVEGRLMRIVRKEDQPLWHWAEATGDIGAASGVAQLIAADHAFRQGYAPGQRAICLTGAVSGDRAAVVVERPSRPASR